jgi:hypothetical protein
MVQIKVDLIIEHRILWCLSGGHHQTLFLVAPQSLGHRKLAIGISTALSSFLRCLSGADN